MLSQSTLEFLKELAENNNRDWFTENRKRYETSKKDLEKLVEALLKGVSEFESLPNTEVKDCIFRINRDVRFSKDKSPYKQWFSAAVGPGGRHSGRTDFYLHIQPGESFLGAGMWAPTPKHLAKFRQEIDFNPQELKGIIEAPAFRAYFPEIWGESLQRMPKGYSEYHPDIALLKRKQLFFMHKYTDADVTSPGFAAEIVKGCRLIKPFCDYLNYLFFDEPEETFEL
ncbi:DUF2461 domain-containing protein [Runella slithyformis]|uniref:DUF2461 domain-containing protein n=1 Tax=Runella slithyformis (strain ATCC 29530 / DSM 19594 / LMG 11500 / NCIMB 11436 / LSU 4) TaxID=761193 RepID=A0A7U3ZPQ7_RUNSL|nr:DUF2461 domain-containing protein [Runella slithyformis]AEI51096.1 Conserved hypothetical protein CHP02453 [Runella slithyformis DSM 19594]